MTCLKCGEQTDAYPCGACGFDPHAARKLLALSPVNYTNEILLRIAESLEVLLKQFAVTAGGGNASTDSISFVAKAVSTYQRVEFGSRLWIVLDEIESDYLLLSEDAMGASALGFCDGGYFTYNLDPAKLFIVNPKEGKLIKKTALLTISQFQRYCVGQDFAAIGEDWWLGTMDDHGNRGYPFYRYVDKNGDANSDKSNLAKGIRPAIQVAKTAFGGAIS